MLKRLSCSFDGFLVFHLILDFNKDFIEEAGNVLIARVFMNAEDLPKIICFLVIFVSEFMCYVDCEIRLA